MCQGAEGGESVQGGGGAEASALLGGNAMRWQKQFQDRGFRTFYYLAILAGYFLLKDIQKQ